MGSWLSNYFSAKTTFDGLFIQAGENLVQMAELLIAYLNTDSLNDKEILFKKIGLLESAGDDCTHKIYLALEKVTFAPFDKKDIRVLASVIDDVADYIQEAAVRTHLYNITIIKPVMKEMAGNILKAVHEIENLIALLYGKTGAADIYAHCRQIKKYEHQTDLIYYAALADLFDNEKDAVVLLKYRDIFSSLETAVNKCKNTADVFDRIFIGAVN